MLAARMTLLPRLLILLLLAVVPFTILAQASSDNHDQVYGYDPLLYNGRVYYFYQPGTVGTQYLFEDFDRHGSVTIRGVTYQNLNINYDIYNQQLILKYNDALGSTKLIEISQAWLESFTINENNFITYTKTDSTNRIYQVLGSGNVKIMYYLSKDIAIDNSRTTAGRVFTSERKDMFVLGNKQLINFKNNSGFIKIFSQAQRDSIKTYIHRHSINVRKANDFIMTDLINYCNTLAGL